MSLAGAHNSFIEQQHTSQSAEGMCKATLKSAGNVTLQTVELDFKTIAALQKLGRHGESTLDIVKRAIKTLEVSNARIIGPQLRRSPKLRLLRQLQQQRRARRQDSASSKSKSVDHAVSRKRQHSHSSDDQNCASSSAKRQHRSQADLTSSFAASAMREETPTAVAQSQQPALAAPGIEVAALREKLKIRVDEDPYGNCPAPVSSFQDLSDLPPYVLSSLARHGISSPMPIQAQALPLVLSGRDVIGLAQTGSGKTLAFLVPASVHLEKHMHEKQVTEKRPAPIALVLAPTRELAVQIADEADKVFADAASSSRRSVHTVCLYGGGDKRTQQNKLWRGAQIVVATPGRLSDFVSSKVLSLNRVSYFVLDEADRMLDMGFHEDVCTVAGQIQPKRQMLFFSATWSKTVQELAEGLCRKGSKPVRISYGRDEVHADGDDSAKNRAREGIVQEVVVVDHTGNDRWEKQEAEKEAILNKHLEEVLNASEQHKVLVFVSQKHLADKVSSRLQDLGYKADSMHGGKSQEYRLWVLDQFRKGELRLLVCTDVIGRGIDIPSVSHVVIHEMGEIDDYIHRIGRTARGRYGKGHALVFFEYWEGSPELASELIDVLAVSQQSIPKELKRIADEVTAGNRKVRTGGNQWKAGSHKW